MFWKRKKKMVDIRELQKRGIMQVPREDVKIPTNKDGFVELNSNSVISPPSPTLDNMDSSGNIMGLMDRSSSSAGSSSSNEVSRKISTQISNLDNKLYKLEQRIELLERKAGVNQSDVGPAGW